VHDSVLATLLVAARGEDAASQAGTAARRALAQLDALRATDSAAAQSQEPMDAHEFVWHLQSITTDLDPDTQFDYDPIPQAQIPADVSQALGEAMGEALRNSIRHAGGAGINSTGTGGAGINGAGIDGTGTGSAGTGSIGTGSTAAFTRAGDPTAQVTRAVHVSVRAAATGTAAIDVTILDDGIGFDPSAVDGARLGIEVSIRGRMSSIPGGHAMVVSRVGDGTRVVLRWRQQAVGMR
jgi:signal transduction histidine kinase